MTRCETLQRWTRWWWWGRREGGAPWSCASKCRRSPVDRGNAWEGNQLIITSLKPYKIWNLRGDIILSKNLEQKLGIYFHFWPCKLEDPGKLEDAKDCKNVLDPALLFLLISIIQIPPPPPVNKHHANPTKVWLWLSAKIWESSHHPWNLEAPI